MDARQKIEAAEPTVESIMELAKTIGMRSSDMMASVCTPTFYVAQDLRNKATDALRAEVERVIASKEAELAAREAEIARLNTLINTPHTDDWITSVELEAAHQQERWGAEHDAGKDAQDWFWLLGYLGGKALASFIKGDRQKGLHHIVSSSAVLLNWHRNVTGQNTGMRPGIAEPAALTQQPPKD